MCIFVHGWFLMSVFVLFSHVFSWMSSLSSWAPLRHSPTLFFPLFFFVFFFLKSLNHNWKAGLFIECICWCITVPMHFLQVLPECTFYCRAPPVFLFFLYVSRFHNVQLIGLHTCSCTTESSHCVAQWTAWWCIWFGFYRCRPSFRLSQLKWCLLYQSNFLIRNKVALQVVDECLRFFCFFFFFESLVFLLNAATSPHILLNGSLTIKRFSDFFFFLLNNRTRLGMYFPILCAYLIFIKLRENKYHL